MSVKLVDLFCGAGGFSTGFAQLKPSLHVGIDYDQIALETFSRNHPDGITYHTDISTLHANHIISMLDGHPDIVLASPPCEEFSLANPKSAESAINRIYGDGSARLILDAIRLIGDLNPSVFIIENVAAVLKGDGASVIRSELERIGMDRIHFNLIRCHHHGNPSKRLRVFISNRKIRLSKTIPSRVIDVIGDLPPLDVTTILSPHRHMPNHDYVPVSKDKLKRIRRTRWGFGARHVRVSRRRTLKDWVRLHPKQVSTSIIGKSRYIHPYENRLLTVREHARLMSYPDEYIFKGHTDSQFDQVGESVPPVVSQKIAEEVMRQIDK
ncbi:DNA cytosine methyltransferase [Candidatus Thorarchaeota archaeon]|nr:MAG: DNA cytosine methyltransferase [Candidatus Thorarchaeota archaeon]